MADIELEYGSGPTVTVLITSLKAMARKANVKFEVRKIEDGMENALHLHLGPSFGQEGAQRLPRTLKLCTRIFQNRDVELSAELGDETIVRRIPAGQSAQQYEVSIRELCEQIR